MLRLLFLFCFFVTLLHAEIEPEQTLYYTADNGCLMQMDLLAHPSDPAKKIQLIWAKPAGDGPFPTLLFLHGSGSQGGALSFVRHMPERMESGFVTAALSLPGFAFSNGPKDLAGDFSQRAVQHVIDYLREHSFIKKDKIGLCGLGVGAITALLAAGNDPQICCLIAANGVYDFFDTLSYDNQVKRVLEKTFYFELNETEIRKRSPLYHVDKICCPMLLFHRETNSSVRIGQVVRFREAALDAGKSCSLIVVPDGEIDEKIPFELIANEGFPFLNRYMKE